MWGNVSQTRRASTDGSVHRNGKSRASASEHSRHQFACQSQRLTNRFLLAAVGCLPSGFSQSATNTCTALLFPRIWSYAGTIFFAREIRSTSHERRILFLPCAISSSAPFSALAEMVKAGQSPMFPE